jgi:hypothetical protein
MPRSKGGNSARTKAPQILQDHTALEQRISTTIIGEFVTPLEVIVEELAADLAAIQRNSVQTADLELLGRHGGTVVVEPAGGFAEETIGRPVLINQGPGGDQDEGAIVSFTAEVVDKRRLRVRWFCAAPAPRTVRIVYLIG